MYESRHDKILHHVAQHGFASLDRLAALCGVSTQTVRRDIVVLAEQKRLLRVHGGAGALPINTDSPFEERRKRHVDKKQIIGKLLEQVIPHNTTLFIGGGTTMEIAARLLVEHEGLYVMTTNLHVALAMQQCKNSTIIVPHGEVQSGTHSLVGGMIKESISNYRMDICLISTASVHSDGDFYEFNHAIASNIKTMKQHSRKIILAADSSKFCDGGVVKVGNLSEVSTLVTDGPVPEPIREIMERAGGEIVCGTDSPETEH